MKADDILRSPARLLALALALTAVLVLAVGFMLSAPFASADPSPEQRALDSAITATPMIEAELMATEDALGLLGALGLDTRPAALAGRVVVELNGEQEKLLQERGIGYTVLRSFVYATGSGQDLSYAYVSGNNPADVPISDFKWSQTTLNISGIPVGNYIAGVDVRVKIMHAQIGDLYIFVNDPTTSYSQRIWDRQGGTADNLDRWFTSLRHWNGAQGNGVWSLFVWDGAAGNTGYIDLWEMRVYYGTLNTPTPTPTCNMSLPTPYDVRVNAGGKEYRDTAGQVWAADRVLQYCTAPYWGATGGETYANPVPIAGTDDDVLYQSQRYYADSSGYTFSVPSPGPYEVTLRFSEIYQSTSGGRRVFDIYIEDQLVAEGVDVVRRAAGLNKPLDLQFVVSVNDEALNVVFSRQMDRDAPFVSAIRVRELAAPTPTPTWTSTPTPVPSPVVLALQPATGNHEAGSVFTVDVVVQAGSHTVDSAQAFLDFDPAYLTVVDAAGSPAGSIIAGSAYPVHLVNVADNATGHINYADGSLTGSPPSGTFVLATIRFKARAAGDARVTFSLASPRQSKLTSGGSNVLDTTTDGRYTITTSGGASSTLSGTVLLQGRPNPPSSLLSVPIRVQFFAPGASTPFMTATATTNANGAFTVTGVPTGTWDVSVKNAQTLSARKLNVIFGATPVAASFGVLKEGDASGDDIVDISDFSALRNTFGLSCGTAGFDAAADFNGDCTVDISDFSLLRTNFLVAGPIIVP